MIKQGSKPSRRFLCLETIWILVGKTGRILKDWYDLEDGYKLGFLGLPMVHGDL